MDREQAKDYLESKDVEISEEEIDKVCKKGKIYGDPVAMIE